MLFAFVGPNKRQLTAAVHFYLSIITQKNTLDLTVRVCDAFFFILTLRSWRSVTPDEPPPQSSHTLWPTHTFQDDSFKKTKQNKILRDQLFPLSGGETCRVH